MDIAVYNLCSDILPHHLADDLHFKSGRKFIQKVVRQGSNGNNFDDTSREDKEKHADDFSVTPKKLVMAVPAFFILCCGLICPCFRTRKRETDQSALVKDPNSSELTVSMFVYSVIAVYILLYSYLVHKQNMAILFGPFFLY